MTLFPPVVEIQAGASKVDISERLRRNTPIVINRGRADEASRTQPSSTAVEVDNTDGAFTPDNPESPWWPHVTRGMPLWVGLDGMTPYLATSGTAGNTATTPHHSSFNVAGDLWLAGEVTLDDWHTFTGGASQYLSYRWGTAGGRSWQFFVDNRTVWLTWSADGTASLSANRSMVPITADGRMAIGVWLDVNNGAGGWTATFYTAPRIAGPWTQLGDPVTGAGTTSVFASTAQLEVGWMAGRTWAAEVRSGDSTGTIVANPDFTAQTPGTTSFADAAGRTWTLAGTAAIRDRHTRFAGTVDSVALSWPKPTPRNDPDPGVARATLQASVSMRRMLQGVKPLQSTLTRFVTSPSSTPRIVAYWPMEDGSDSTSAASPIPGVRPMGVTGDFRFAADSSLASSGPLPSVAGGRPGAFGGPVPPAAGTQWRADVFCYIETPHTSPAFQHVMVGYTTGTVTRWAVAVDDTDVTITLRDHDGTLLASASIPSDARFFGTWVLWSLNIEQDGSNVDWALSIVPIPLGAAFGTSGTIAGTVGRFTKIASQFTAAPPDGITFGHVIVSTGNGLGWLAGSDTAWVGETAAHRFYRLCRESQLPYAIIGDPNVTHWFRGDPAMSELMGPQRQAPLLELFEECVDTDGGRMLERRDVGGLVFRSRRSMYNQTSAVTFDVDARGLAAPFEPTLDTQFLRNDVTASRPDGSSARTTTSPPPDPGDTYDDEFDVNVQYDEQLPDQAGWRLHLRSDPGARYPGWSTSLGNAGPGVRAAWADLIEGDRVTATALMAQHPETADVLVDGWQEVIDLFTWRATVNGSPATPWEVGIREDPDRGRRDTAGSTVDSAITATATSVDVDTTVGPLWTVAAGDYPFDLWIGGEQVTATAASGASTPQTFTIVRSVNGVVKSHAAGTEVRLWRPTVRAL
jgi:hypothetical protein